MGLKRRLNDETDGMKIPPKNKKVPQRAEN